MVDFSSVCGRHITMCNFSFTHASYRLALLFCHTPTLQLYVDCHMVFNYVNYILQQWM
jgi:hypothetical protein